VLPLVAQNGLSLEFVSHALKADVEVVTEAGLNNFLSLQHASCLQHPHLALLVDGNPELLKDHSLQSRLEAALTAVKIDGLSLQHLPWLFQNDVATVRAAVQQNGLALSFAQKLKQNTDIVMEAVRENGLALQYASAGCQQNTGIVTEAVRQNGLALHYASVGCQQNRGIVMEAVRQNGLALQYANASLASSFAVVSSAVRENATAMSFAASGSNQKQTVAAIALLSGALADAEGT